MSEMVTMWSVRAAVTKGVLQKVEGTVSQLSGTDTVYFKFPGNSWDVLRVGKDVFRTQEEAAVVARQLIARKMISLEKSLAKLRKNPLATPATSA